MINNTSEIYSIKITNLTKKFRKKSHKGIFSFLKRNHNQTNAKEISKFTLALNNVNIKIHQGELFGLLGPNGSGKTTMIKCLSTILIPDEGTVSVNGFDVKKETSMVRASLGMVVGGERTLYWKLTARDNLMYFSSLYKMERSYAKKRIIELLENFELIDRADERLEDYSTGMRQKVAIARALLHDPPILLLDEPTIGLDPNISRQIRQQIKELSVKQGKTIFLTTHYMDEAAQLCDRITIMDNGKIIENGKPSELIKKHVGEEVLEVIFSEEAMQCLKKTFPDARIDVVDEKIVVFTQKPRGILAKVLEETSFKGAAIRDSNLEDVFLKLAGRSLKD